ncbi:MAG TPA: lytic transglycosylase domain-containing protein, partial [Sphingomicrobium sp.]|nr:lytic transglycosylase domain-containing protein [Sphingomicrobium sp.]
MRIGWILCASLAVHATAAAQDDPLAPLDPAPAKAEPIRQEPAPQIQPTQPLPPPRVIPRDWAGVFAAIDGGDWEGARLGIEALPNGPLKPYARAELFTARGSPKVELGPVLAVLAEAPELPHAEQLARLAIARGATESPAIHWPRATVSLGSAPRRGRTRSVEGDPAADQFRLAVEPYVKVDDGAGAEALYLAALPYLSVEARAEAAHRVAWIYFVGGRDADARRVADQGRVGARGDWAAQAAWISGLASFRIHDCSAAYAAFRDAAALGREPEFNAAAHFWTARAAQSCRRPREVAPLLRAAARSQESFYGLLAREALGIDKRLPRTTEPRDLA